MNRFLSYLEESVFHLPLCPFGRSRDKVEAVIQPLLAKRHPLPARLVGASYLLGTNGQPVTALGEQMAFKGHPIFPQSTCQ